MNRSNVVCRRAHRCARMVRALACAPLLAAPIVAAHADPPFFMVLPDLPGGVIDNFAHAISADGATVVGASESANSTVGLLTTEAYRWTLAGGIEPLGDLAGGDFHSAAFGVSPDGSVVVGISRAGGALNTDFGEAFRWTAATGMQSLGFIGGNFTILTQAEGVTADGNLVVGLGGAQSEPFFWTPATGIQELPRLDPAIADGEAHAVTPDGSTIVGSRRRTGEPRQAVIWHGVGGGLTPLGNLPNGVGAIANDVSDDGAVVVGFDSIALSGGGQSPEAFRWTAATGIQGLGFLPNSGAFPASRANAVSADGSVVVGFGNAQGVGEGRAFIWDPGHGMRNLQNVLVNDLGLDLGGVVLGEATDISADGRTIIGIAGDPVSGARISWIAHLGPPPCPNDLDGDGVVGPSDLLALLAGFGSPFTPTDLLNLLADFGKVCP